MEPETVAQGSSSEPSAALAPPLAEVPLPAEDAASLLWRNASEHTDLPALRFGDHTWTHGELLVQAELFAALYRSRLDPDRPLHVGVLLDNTPDYVFALCGAALSGVTLAGLNDTRRGEHLGRDVSHTDLQLIITEPRHEAQLEAALEGLDVPVGVLVSERFVDADDPPAQGESLQRALEGADGARQTALQPGDVDHLWVLLFTSGTSAAPKAVRCTQHRLLTTGNRMAMMLELGPEDVGYAAMPLFHTNSLMSAFAPALVSGASLSLARRFSASQFLADVRRYGVTWFNYTGKVLTYLLATPAQPDDADTTLRVAFGNEGSPYVVAAAADRFGMRIIDVFGSTEGAIALDRTGDRPPGSVGRLRQGIMVVDENGHERPRVRFDEGGRILNADECVGEIVNTLGVGPFEGYYDNEEAMNVTTRNGWYWSGDLAYVDDQSWVYFAGRNAEWLRVDGESFPAGPVESVVERHPDVVLVSVYGVPDPDAGDQVMAALVLNEGVAFDGASFASWLDTQPDLGPKWRPRFIRVCQHLPSTPTNKILKRTLVHEKFRSDRVGTDRVFLRARGEDAFRPFGVEQESELRSAFEASGRSNAWDL
jgi:fatty-acyl-CoA synthase